jgi:hypothetical protein
MVLHDDLDMLFIFIYIFYKLVEFKYPEKIDIVV